MSASREKKTGAPREEGAQALPWAELDEEGEKLGPSARILGRGRPRATREQLFFLVPLARNPGGVISHPAPGSSGEFTRGRSVSKNRFDQGTSVMLWSLLPEKAGRVREKLFANQFDPTSAGSGRLGSTTVVQPEGGIV